MQITRSSKTLFVGFFTVLLALLFLLGFYFFLSVPKGGGESLSLVYTVKIPMVREALFDGVAVGDTLIESAGKREIGTVTQIETRPAVTERYSESEGRYVLVTKPDFVDVYLTLAAQASASDTAVTVDGYRLAVGAPIYLRLPAFSGVGYCTEFEELYEP